MAPKLGAALGSSSRQCWLMKAEPDLRMEKGKNVAFSVDIFAASPNKTTSWDGVRNPEATKMMKLEMKLNDDVLFYHSNCKLPGIAGLAKIVRQGYPDHSAWDSSHPYFDAKTDKDNPKWYMVDVQLLRKLPFLVPLALLQYLSSSTCTHSLPYLSKPHLEAISKMQLLNRGRLSVQRVEPTAFEAISLLGDKGGWQDWPGKWNTKTKPKSKAQADVKTPAAANEPMTDEKSQKASKKRDKEEKEKEKKEKEKSSQPAKRRSKRTRTS